MITMRQLVRYIGAEPFRPFRITMASGQVFEIRRPEMASVGRSTAHIYSFVSDDDEQAKQREHEVSRLSTESVEPLEATAAQENRQ